MAMTPPYRHAPTLRPMPPHLLEDLQPAARTHTPSERGYLDRYPIGAVPHPEELQKQLVKLFFARYMSVSDDQIEAAIGHDNNPRVNLQSYRQQRRNHLRSIWWGMRYKTFGEDSFFDRIVRHTVEQYDFDVAVYNIAATEYILKQVPLNETDTERATREANLERFSQAKADHVSRYNASRNDALQQAERNLQYAGWGSTSGMTRAQRRAQNDLIEEAKRLVEHHKAHNAPWPNAPVHVAASCPVGYYHELSTRATQLLWQSMWSLDVGTTMLWEVGNVVDIPATLDNAGFIYKTAFVIFCIEAAHICPEGSTDIGRMKEVLAKPQNRKVLYRHLGEASMVHWPNEPGLDLLRISAGSPRSAKRKADALGSSHAGLNFTKK
jgi:hypothetical protein